MNIKVVTGGVVEKNGKFLLVKEKQEICKGKWNIPAGGLDPNESLTEGAEREIYEETGCKVKATGILEIFNEVLEGVNVVCFFFDTKIMDEEIKVDGKEISSVKWFTYDEIQNMKDELRADGYFLRILKNKIDNNILPLDLIRITKNNSKSK